MNHVYATKSAYIILCNENFEFHLAERTVLPSMDRTSNKRLIRYLQPNTDKMPDGVCMTMTTVTEKRFQRKHEKENGPERWEGCGWT